jgi:hypothetical protein
MSQPPPGSVRAAEPKHRSASSSSRFLPYHTIPLVVVDENLPKFQKPYIDTTASNGERDEPAKGLLEHSQTQDGDGANVLCPRKAYSKSTIGQRRLGAQRPALNLLHIPSSDADIIRRRRRCAQLRAQWYCTHFSHQLFW